MLDASALTLGVPATALPDAALAAAGLPSAQQMAADSVSTDRALDPPSYSTEGAGAEPWSSCMVAMGAGCSGMDGVESLSLNRTRKATAFLHQHASWFQQVVEMVAHWHGGDGKTSSPLSRTNKARTRWCVFTTGSVRAQIIRTWASPAACTHSRSERRECCASTRGRSPPPRWPPRRRAGRSRPPPPVTTPNIPAVPTVLPQVDGALEAMLSWNIWSIEE